MSFTKGDKLVTAAVVFISLLIYIVFSANLISSSAMTVEITVNSKPYAAYRLEDIKDKKTIEIETELGKNVVEITKDGACIVDASCPDKLDVKCGKITKPNQIIVCIPNRVTVVLKGNKKNEIDKVTY